MLTDRQLEIIHTSIKLISSKGIQGLTMKNLSKEIGISEPAIYRHYENKIEILISILDYFSTTTQMIFVSEVQKTGSSLDKIQRIFDNHFKVFSETPSLVAVIFSEEIFRSEPLLAKKVKEIMERNSRAIQAILEEGKQNGEIDQNHNVQHLAIIIMGSLRLLIKQWQMADFAFDLQSKGIGFFKTLKQLVGAKISNEID
ncbi:MAG: TetR/AcrR family transcriptional regulator [Bacteroidales bacterium]|nr:TetR/AcrR family transcriptional regulator [Bacteroidales bacterium]MDP2238162.1 TetR/AcrR family transcriptional regulator [Bacteroidales bacterium]